MGLSLRFGAETTPDQEVIAPIKPPKFGFPLPFDPIRLIAGVLARWPWIVIGMIIMGILGTLAGVSLARPSFAISASLIKRRVPQTVRTSETGQAYRPVDLNDATLLATLLASEPLDLAISRAANNLDPGSARALTEAKQLEGTDIFYITYHSPISAEDALTFTGIWAEEINAYTKRLQQTEAHGVRLILEKEVHALDKQIDDTNLEILNFSKEKGYLGGETQVASALSQLSQIDMQLDTARTSASAKEQQLKNFNDQIQRQSPIELQLKTAKEELANLRASYTDANPLVQTKLQSIEYLNEQIEKLGGNKGNNDLESYTGTPLGNQLYLSIISLRNEYLAAATQIKSLEESQQIAAARLREFPGIISTYDALKNKRNTFTEGLSLMSNRLKEAEIFASGAPGYWQVFQAPDPRRVIPSSMLKKPAALGAVGAILGGMLAVMLTLLLTQRSSRRSILECCAATRAPLVANIPAIRESEAREAVAQLWVTHLARRLGNSIHLMLWTPAIEPADERKFWLQLAEAAWKDTGKPIRVLDFTPDALWSESPLPDSMDWFACPQSASYPVQLSTRSYTATLVRAAAFPHGDARDLLPQIDHWISVVSNNKDSLRRLDKLRSITEVYLPPCDGTIALTECPDGLIRQAGELLSGFLVKRFS
ncbi:MAG: hypothetical protein ABI600_14595 [Luteolibacter sp.]